MYFIQIINIPSFFVIFVLFLHFFEFFFMFYGLTLRTHFVAIAAYKVAQFLPLKVLLKIKIERFYVASKKKYSRGQPTTRDGTFYNHTHVVMPSSKVV